MSHTEIVRSLAEYVRVIDGITDRIYKCEEKFFCERDILLFRGQANSEWGLVPSVGRKNGCPYDNFVFWNEKNIIDKAKLEYPDVFCKSYSPIELLAIMQHYGIPTRLLDVTENSLVALYFACESYDNNDGGVFVFWHREDRIGNSSVLEILANIYNLMDESEIFVENLLGYAKEKMGIFVDENVFKNACRSTNFVVAPKVNRRQIVQQSRYILFGNKLNKAENSLTTYIQELVKNDKSIIGKIVIPHENKTGILKSLKTVGISGKSLFPDDVSVGCREIVREFGY